MKQICNGKINYSGRCTKCFAVSQTTSAYCTRLVDVSHEDILRCFAEKMSNIKDIDPEIQAVLTPEFFNELLKKDNET